MWSFRRGIKVHLGEEIWALRKSGDILKAFQVAEKYLKEYPHDDNILKPYAFLIMDKIKECIELNKIEEAKKYIKQLIEIQFQTQDEFIVTINERRGWCIYKYIKSKSKNLAQSKQFLPLEEIRELFVFYLFKIQPQKPSILHSLMLKLAKDYFKDNPFFRFYGFFETWGFDSFMPEDWQSFKIQKEYGENITYPPLAIGAIKNACKSIRKIENIQQEKIIRLIEVAKNALKKYDYIWLKRELAALYRKIQEKQKAIDIYREIIKEKKDFFIWQEFASLVEDINVKIAFLIQALMRKNKEKFMVNVRLDLAESLILLQEYEFALYELNLYLQCIQNNGGKVDPRFSQLMAKMHPNIEAQNILKSPKKDDYLNKMKQFLYGEVTKILVAVFKIEHKNKEVKTITKERQVITLGFKQFSEKAEVGDILEILYTQGGEVISAEKTKEQAGDLIVEFEGELMLKYKKDNSSGIADFAFVKDYYISKKLLEKYKIDSNCKVAGKAVITEDKDKPNVFMLQIIE